MERLPLPQLRGNIGASLQNIRPEAYLRVSQLGCRAKVGRVWDLGFKVLVGPPKQVERK